jgi:hypothetical protein
MSTTNFELHAPHWHGNIVTVQHMKTDVVTLGTMGMMVADMIPDNPGTLALSLPHRAAFDTGDARALHGSPGASRREPRW